MRMLLDQNKDMVDMDSGSLRKLLICIAVLALLAGVISPLALSRQASAATALDWTSAQGPGNGDAPAMVWDNTRHILYRATSGRGVWKYQAGAWTPLGGAVNTTGITSLAFDDSGNKLYAGTNGAGVWCYNPAGGTWSNIATTEITTWYITCMPTFPHIHLST
jgi:hypothetical protein